MLDPKYLRHALDEMAQRLATRGYTLDTDLISQLETQRKALQTETQNLQSQANHYAKQIGSLKADTAAVDTLLPEVNRLKAHLTTLEHTLKTTQQQLEAMALTIPNLPHHSVPIGSDASANVILRHWGDPKRFDFTPKDHVTLGQQIGGIDFAMAAQMTAARFVILQGPLARLQRALIQFMLDVHTRKHNYQEVYVPCIVNQQSLITTGQLPNFADDLFALKGENHLYLIPTAEVPVSNIARGMIFSADELPKKYVCHTPCFRSEAGSYGQDTRGMIRQHQFEKVELLQFLPAENSYAALEKLTSEAETILQKLQLPYRVVALCTGDLGFSAAKTYDLEVWLPSQNTYREVSSCTNFADFQARRLQARWRNPHTAKVELLHTINGSGLAVGRTLLAIMENYQDQQGNVHIPEVLWDYMAGVTMIRPFT